MAKNSAFPDTWDLNLDKFYYESFGEVDKVDRIRWVCRRGYRYIFLLICSLCNLINWRKTK